MRPLLNGGFFYGLQRLHPATSGLETRGNRLSVGNWAGYGKRQGQPSSE